MNPNDPLYDDASVANLPDDPWEALAQVCTRFTEWFTSIPGDKRVGHHETVVDAYALLRTLVSHHKEYIRGIPDTYRVKHSHEDNVKHIAAQFEQIGVIAQHTLGNRTSDHHFTTSSERYEAMLADELRIQFHDDEIKQLQSLINDLRDAISACESLEANHKYRLLRRLGRLQTELHKEVSNLDSMWMFIGDAAFVLGQAAKDAKPISELVRGIMRIARIAMARTHGLPAGAIQDFLLEDKAVVSEPTSIAPGKSSSA